MNVTKYLEFSSMYRNRNEWPLPSNFEILISQTGTNDKKNALDPISNFASLLTFTGSFRTDVNSATVTGTISLTTPQITTSSTTTNFYIIPDTSGSLRNEDNFYNGAIIELTNGTDVVRRNIQSHKYITDDLAQISILNPIPDSILSNTTTWTITNPTDLSISRVFIPFSPLSDNYWINFKLHNITKNEYQTIQDFDGKKGIAYLGNNITGWDIADLYAIRKNIPNEYKFGGTSVNNVVILDTSSSDIDNFYKGDFIQILYQKTPSIPYQASLNIIDTYKIVEYNGQTKEAKLNKTPYFPLDSSYSYELLPFTTDNAVPFNYSGSLVSQQESVCYEIELISLILPNKNLIVGRGGRIAYYPYVYVELQNISSASSGNINTMYSNNPNATKMLFKCNVDDVPNPLTTPFIKIDSDGQKQTVKFKPNDNMKFSVRLPNGEIFQTEGTEYFNPIEPNPLMQISAIFSIKRL